VGKPSLVDVYGLSALVRDGRDVGNLFADIVFAIVFILSVFCGKYS
jgi:hypothetical protein